MDKLLLSASQGLLPRNTKRAYSIPITAIDIRSHAEKNENKQEEEEANTITAQIMMQRQIEKEAVKHAKIKRTIDNIIYKWMDIAKIPLVRNHDCVNMKCSCIQVVIKCFRNHTCCYGMGIRKCIGINSYNTKSTCPQSKPLWEYNDVFVCPYSRNIHMCGVYCKLEAETTKDRELICPISRLCTESDNLVDSFWKPNTTIEQQIKYTDNAGNAINQSFFSDKSRKRGVSYAYKKKSVSMNTVTDFNGWLNDLMRIQTIEGISLHMKNAISKLNSGCLEEFKVVACSKIWFLFCEERYNTDHDRLTNSRHNAMLTMMDILRTTMTHPSQHIIDWTSLENIYHQEISVRRMSMVRLYPEDSNEAQRQKTASFVYEYALKIIKFWCVIRDVTPYGRHNPDKFCFCDFVIPCLYIIRSGITLPCKIDPENQIVILPPDQKLGLMITEEDNAVSLLGKNNNFSCVQKNIMIAFSTAINEHHIAHDMLDFVEVDVSRYSYLFTACTKRRRKKTTHNHPSKRFCYEMDDTHE